MPTLNDVSLDSFITLLKGEPGTRKSTCALSYPTPQYWISSDRKMGALALPAKRWGMDLTKDIHYDDYSDWNKPLAKLKKFQVSCPYKTVIVDSLTSFGDNITSQVRTTKGKESGGKIIGGISVNGLEEFNAESAAFSDLLNIVCDIQDYNKINVILIAHVIGVRKDDPSNSLTHHSRIIVSGAERVSNKISSRMHEVYHFNVESSFDVDKGEGNYTLFTQHTGNDYARTSLPLNKKITFNNEPLYEKYIQPAILNLKNMAPVVRISSQQTMNTQTTQTKPQTTNFTAK